MSPTQFVFDADENNFQTMVVERSFDKPVVVDFWAPWCGPCRALGPALEKAVNARNGEVFLAKVNTDECPQLAAYFQIESIPAVKAIHKGQLVMQFEGALPPAQIEEFLNRIAPKKSDAAKPATAGLEKKDPAKAEAEYQKKLEKTPDDAEALLGLARLRLDAGRFDEIDKLLEPIISGGEHGAEADRIRALRDLKKIAAASFDESAVRARIAANADDAQAHCDLGSGLAGLGRYEEALKSLLAASEIDRDLGKGAVRELMVKIFHVIGVRSELADEYRAKLQRTIY